MGAWLGLVADGEEERGGKLTVFVHGGGVLNVNLGEIGGHCRVLVVVRKV